MAVGRCVHSFIKPASIYVLSTQYTVGISQSQSIPVIQHRKKVNTDHFMFYEGNKLGVIGILCFRDDESRYYLR